MQHESAGGPAEPGRQLIASAPVSWEAWATGLYGVWGFVAWLASFSGAAPLQPGAGLILGVGVALTAALFHAVARMPEGERPPTATSVAAQCLMGIIWATLYAQFAGITSPLAPGMYMSAVIFAVPGVDLPRLRRLMLGTVVAYAVVVLLQSSLLAVDAGPADGPSHITALAAMLLAVYIAADRLARTRQSLETRHDALRRTMERAARRAERDPLTRSYNRRHIMEVLAHEKARVDRTREPFCVCLLDIDHFKSMNDRFGHLAGDRVLAAFTRRVRGELRTMDTVNRSELRSSLGRYGGEEFIVILPLTSLRGALRVAERIRSAIVRRPFDGLHHVTVSIGIADYRPGETIGSLLGRTDEALYAAKRGGRNRVHCAAPEGGPSAIVMPDIPAAS